MRVIEFNLSERSIQGAISELKKYQKWVNKKAAMVAARLAQAGADNAQIRFASAIYNDC